MAELPGGRTGAMRIYGRTGLVRFSGHVYEEQLRQLAGTRAAKVFSEMRDNDPVIGAVLFMVEMLIRQVEWTVKPATEEKADRDNAQFVDECRQDMSHTWEDLMAEVLSMLVFGWAYFEIVYKRRQGPSADPTKRSRYTDGRIGWRKIELRAQETLDEWEFEEDGGVKGMWQQAPPHYERVFIPIEKSLLFRTKSAKNNPEGRSYLRNMYRPWFFKKRLEELEAIGIERDLVNIPILEVPPEMMLENAPSELQTLKSDLEKMGSELKRDEREFVMLPAEIVTTPTGQDIRTGYKLRPFQSGGQRQFLPDVPIRRYESRMAMSVMAQFLLLGQDKVGSFSLASESTNLFSVAIGAILKSIAAVLNRYAIPRLFALNNIQAEQLPEFVPGDIEEEDLEKWAKGLGELVKNGIIIPGPSLERHARQKYELPDLEEDEEAAAENPRRRALTEPKQAEPARKPAPEEDVDE